MHMRIINQSAQSASGTNITVRIQNSTEEFNSNTTKLHVTRSYPKKLSACKSWAVWSPFHWLKKVAPVF